MVATGMLMVSLSSSLVMTMVLDSPVTKSRPLTSATLSSGTGKALPSPILSCSAVWVPTETWWLMLNVGCDGRVHRVTGYPDRCPCHDASQGDYGNLAGSTAHVDDHGPPRLIDRHIRTYGCRQGFFNGVRAACPRRLSRLLDRPKLNPRNPRGHAHRDPGPEEVRVEGQLGTRLADEVGEHLLRDLEVGYHPVLQGLRRDDVRGRAPNHALGCRPNSQNLLRFLVYGDD